MKINTYKLFDHFICFFFGKNYQEEDLKLLNPLGFNVSEIFMDKRRRSLSIIFSNGERSMIFNKVGRSSFQLRNYTGKGNYRLRRKGKQKFIQELSDQVNTKTTICDNCLHSYLYKLNGKCTKQYRKLKDTIINS